MSTSTSDPSGLFGTQHLSGSKDALSHESARNVSLGDLLREAAKVSGDRVALVDALADFEARRRWTYAELLGQAKRVAYALLKRFRPGDRIAVCSPNCPEWVILMYGTALAGMILVPVFPGYCEAEMGAIIEGSGASALFYAGQWRDNDIEAVAAQVRSSQAPGLALISMSKWDDFLASGETVPLPPVHPRDPVLIQFTSGTTGKPKGALLHHGLSNPPRDVMDCCGFSRYGVWLSGLPMYHLAGNGTALMASLSRHGAFVLMREWDPALALELIESERCNATLLVPTMIVSMLDHPDCGLRDLSSLEFILSGAAPVPPALYERITERIGCRLMICFGQTESGGPVSTTMIGDGPHELANTLGRALPNVQVEIHDPETGKELPPGAIGEMWFKSPYVMLGYYGLEEQTRAAFTPDGWLRSGDLGTVDERGYLSITGRLKDLIIRGGENIYPREIEDALFEHPAVAQAAVIGIPHEKWGEIVLAVVQAAHGHKLEFHELQQHCRDRLASFKVPALWSQTDSFPLNPSGKIQKLVLADWVRDGRLEPISLR
ncbi:MAG: class I adenylate-forming enzyme family protein [Sphingobium sp.]